MTPPRAYLDHRPTLKEQREHKRQIRIVAFNVALAVVLTIAYLVLI